MSPVRGGVERVFGTCKRSYALGRARLWNGARNRVDIAVKLMAYNLRRTMSLDPRRPQAA